MLNIKEKGLTVLFLKKPAHLSLSTNIIICKIIH